MANQITSSDFLICDEPARILDILATNHGGAPLTAADLERLPFPTGGGLHFDVPTPGGNEPRREFRGIIVHVGYHRAYWQESFDQRSAPEAPDCASADSIVGHGDPGGVCALCQHSKFDRNQAAPCRIFADVFFLVSGELLPTLFRVPTGSIRALKKYLFSLTKRGLPYFHVVTEFSLERATNGRGIVFSRLVCKLVWVLNDQQRPRATEIAVAFTRVLTESGAVGEK
jgi:hypothetical protein